MFANCKVLYQNGKVLDRLRKKAETIIKKEHARLKSFEVELAKYSLDDLRKDLNDVYLRDDDFAFMIITNQILDTCIKTFRRVKRKHLEKSKRLQAQLKKLDPNFEKKYREAMTESGKNKKIKKLVSLIEYTEKLLGGKRPKEWKLRSKTTV